MWARGLKHVTDTSSSVRVWSRPMWARGLKLQILARMEFEYTSRPMWARGLKQKQHAHRKQPDPVAPHVGAWIETYRIQVCLPAGQVAPHVGAWIETVVVYRCRRDSLSRPMWARGLKPPTLAPASSRDLVAPHVGAWIETVASRVFAAPAFVAPHVGAWIETRSVPMRIRHTCRRAPCGRVD